MKKIISLMLTVSLIFSVSAFAVNVPKPSGITAENGAEKAIDETTRIVQQTEDGVAHFIWNGDWRYVVAVSDSGRVIFSAINSSDENKLYQKITTMPQLMTQRSGAQEMSEADINSIVEENFLNLADMPQFEIKSVQMRSSAKVDLEAELAKIYGSPYVDRNRYTGEYMGKVFRVNETMVSSVNQIDSRTFAVGVAVVSVVLAFSPVGGILGPTIALVNKVLSVGSVVEAIIVCATSFVRYECVASISRDTYMSGYPNVLNTTRVEYMYCGLDEINTSERAYLEHNYTFYGDGEGYYTNYNLQVQDAYQSYFG